MPRYTISEVRKWIDICMDAKRKILEGRVANYSIGSRSVTYLTLEQVNKELLYWENMLEEIKNGGRSRFKRVIPLG